MPEPAVVCQPLAAAATAVAADLSAPKDLGRAHLALQREARRGNIMCFLKSLKMDGFNVEFLVCFCVP